MFGVLRTRLAAVLFAALLAFSWQSFVVQTHIHFEPYPASGVAIGHSAVADPGPARGPADTPANCPICHEIAHGGVYLLPTLAAFEAPAPAPVWQPVTTQLAHLASKRSHAWRSRAPPALLQA